MLQSNKKRDRDNGQHQLRKAREALLGVRIALRITDGGNLASMRANKRKLGEQLLEKGWCFLDENGDMRRTVKGARMLRRKERQLEKAVNRLDKEISGNGN